MPISSAIGKIRPSWIDLFDVVDYYDLMMDNIDEVAEKQFAALCIIEKEQLQVAKQYNKKVWLKDFQIDDLVWKVILSTSLTSRKFGKWSPHREGPF
jgi:hypothetical protein